ncbi:DUF2787 family protein [Alishewanella sp. SMS8]|uniref:DUF2787 family protein n=1 Tax=Alishewanella sp. SMS8 TaxID=2994676 RepID=UPI002741C476|nr:DUF2787 family protein [Alishewanella sp. SMS8]MDP5459583.1 DUF2787 family protein [Alishewanella sp. SMS8]
MEQTIELNGLALPVSNELAQVLLKQLIPATEGLDTLTDATINFRDPEYCAESGGYHPVEVRLVWRNSAWQIDYITSFSFVGMGWCAELAKELDFDFGQNCFEMRGYRPQVLGIGEEMYRLFEQNFIEYVRMEVFDVVTTVED